MNEEMNCMNCCLTSGSPTLFQTGSQLFLVASDELPTCVARANPDLVLKSVSFSIVIYSGIFLSENILAGFAYSFWQLLQQGLQHYTWRMKESADFIESAMSLVCLDVHQNLDIVQTNCHDIAAMTISWSQGILDVFSSRQLNMSYSMEELLEMQK